MWLIDAPACYVYQTQNGQSNTIQAVHATQFHYHSWKVEVQHQLSLEVSDDAAVL